MPANLKQHRKVLSGVSKYWEALARIDGMFCGGTIFATKVAAPPPPQFLFLFYFYRLAGCL